MEQCYGCKSLAARIEQTEAQLRQVREVMEAAASAPGKDWLEWQLKLGEALAAQDAGTQRQTTGWIYKEGGDGE